MSESDGSLPENTAKTPANEPTSQSPPRINAPGIWLPPPLPFPPKQLKSLPGRPVCVVQSVHPPLARSAQSATHSSTLPIMSNTPQLDLQFVREPGVRGRDLPDARLVRVHARRSDLHRVGRAFLRPRRHCPRRAQRQRRDVSATTESLLHVWTSLSADDRSAEPAASSRIVQRPPR